MGSILCLWGQCSDEVINRGDCDANIALKWMTQVSSSVYGTPLIHDLFSDGQKEVIVPSFVHHLEVCGPQMCQFLCIIQEVGEFYHTIFCGSLEMCGLPSSVHHLEVCDVLWYPFLRPLEVHGVQGSTTPQGP